MSSKNRSRKTAPKAPEVEAEPAPVTEEVFRPEYSEEPTGQWKGAPLWECPKCRHSTLDPEVFRTHVCPYRVRALHPPLEIQE